MQIRFFMDVCTRMYLDFSFLWMFVCFFQKDGQQMICAIWVQLVAIDSWYIRTNSLFCVKFASFALLLMMLMVRVFIWISLFFGEMIFFKKDGQQKICWRMNAYYVYKELKTPYVYVWNSCRMRRVCIGELMEIK